MVRPRLFICVTLISTSIIWAQEMKVKDADENVLMSVEDEGAKGKLNISSAKADSLEISPIGVAPVHIQNKLYNIGGGLYWNGTQLSTSGSTPWQKSGGNVFLSTNTDNVGIGTSSPGVRLEVAGQSSTPAISIRNLLDGDYGALSGGRAVSSSGYTLLRIAGENYQNSTWQSSAWIDFISGSGIDGGDNDSPGAINLATTPDGTALPVTRMHINQYGNVGIGTTDPKTRLDLSSDSNLYLTLRTSGTNYAEIDFKNGPGAGATDRGGWMGFSFNTNQFLWGTKNSSGVEGTRMVLEQDGNVGIGITSPAEMLDVSGAVKLGSTVNTNAGTMRWTGSDFEGYDGSSWKSLTSGGSGGADADWTVSGDNMWATVSGNVGIGQSNPIDKFEVLQTGTGRASSIRINNSDNNNFALYLETNNTGGSYALRARNDYRGSYADIGGYYGIYASGNGSFGLYAYNGGSNTGYGGVYGVSGYGYGVKGHSSLYYGIYGTTHYDSGYAGVYGRHEDRGNYGYIGHYGYGVYGYAANGYGLYGTSNNNRGVYGWSSSSQGVYGYSSTSYGVNGYSSESFGVYGETSDDNGSAGVYGNHYDRHNFGQLGTYSYGVYGRGNNGVGVFGSSTNSAAISGSGTNHYGVYASSSNYYGLYGITYHESSYAGIYGKHNSNGTYGYVGLSQAGIYGGSINSYYGVQGYSSSGNAIYGSTSTGKAGYFDGDVTVTGTITEGSAAAQIDHPLDPENKYLNHAYIVFPDMMNVYNGNVTLDNNGEAVVKLPDYFDALNKDYRYQLTSIGAPGPNIYIAQEIKGNSFKIAGGAPGAKVSWQVTGIRQDAYANANRIQVEQVKTGKERGHYLHPKAFGLSDAKGLNYDEILRREELEAQLEQERERDLEERKRVQDIDTQFEAKRVQMQQDISTQRSKDEQMRQEEERIRAEQEIRHEEEEQRRIEEEQQRKQFEESLN